MTAALSAVIVVAACGNADASGSSGHHPLASASSSVQAPDPTPAVTPSRALQPSPLVDPAMDLRAGPVSVPLQLQIPSLRIDAPVLGVGLTPKNVMDTPTGSASSSVWQKAFWYRGGGTPGDAGTATIAGHVDDVLGRPAIFANLKDLRPGDPVVVQDERTGREIDFVVTTTATYTVQQTLNPAILAQIYGPGPVAGQGPQPSTDGLSHLTLITCTGHWINRWGTYDHRLAVYAISVPSRLDSQHQRS
jgi:Sortase domain